jgi:hypothetical protein
MKARWKSESEQLKGKLALREALLQKFSFFAPAIRYFDILNDWLDRPFGRVVLGTVALSAAWFLLN